MAAIQSVCRPVTFSRCSSTFSRAPAVAEYTLQQGSGDKQLRQIVYQGNVVVEHLPNAEGFAEKRYDIGQIEKWDKAGYLRVPNHPSLKFLLKRGWPLRSMATIDPEYAKCYQWYVDCRQHMPFYDRFPYSRTMYILLAMCGYWAVLWTVYALYHTLVPEEKNAWKWKGVDKQTIFTRDHVMELLGFPQDHH